MNLTEAGLNAILNSDFKLWEQATTTESGLNAVTKTVTLPYGIGEYSLRFEGVDNAEGRRNAAGIWGQSVRDVVENTIGDEAVTSRARQAGPRVGETPNQGVDSTGPAPEVGRETASPRPAEAHAKAIFAGGADTALVINGLRGELFDTLARVGELKREIAGLDAYLKVTEAMNDAQEVQTEAASSKDGESASDVEEVKPSDATP